jgi:putative MATE family efflux protein
LRFYKKILLQEEKMENQKSLNKMGTMPVNKLMLSLGTPIILSMVLQALYNIVDSAFVSNMPLNGEAALNALTLAFPVQVLMIAIGIGTGVGVNVLLSQTLGMGDHQKASKVCGNAIFLGLVIYLLFLLFGLFFTEAYIASQTTNPLILNMAVSYLKICCILSMGNVLFAIFEKLLQATGLSLYSTIAMITGAVINIILDPILIYGLLGLPALGVDGAAYATIIGQIAAGGTAFFFHLKHNHAIKNGVQYLKPSAHIISQIYSIGLPAIIAQALMSLMTYGFNIILVQIGESMVTAYGLYYKIQQFVLFAAFGLRDAITPIVAFNYGMKNTQRVKEGIRYGITYTLCIMVIGIAIIEIFAVPLAEIFGLSGLTESLCVSAMRIISVSFIFAGVNIALQGIFQALGVGVASLIISLCRQLVFVLPVAFWFSQFAKASLDNAFLVWTTFIIAEGLTALIAVGLLKHQYHQVTTP